MNNITKQITAAAKFAYRKGYLNIKQFNALLYVHANPCCSYEDVCNYMGCHAYATRKSNSFFHKMIDNGLIKREISYMRVGYKSYLISVTELGEDLLKKAFKEGEEDE